jgi:hypothetical protein
VHEYVSGRSGGVEAMASTVCCHADRGAVVLQTELLKRVRSAVMLAAVCKHVPECCRWSCL